MSGDSSTIGGRTLPLAVPNSGETIADRPLDLVLAYIRALFNAYASAAWHSVAPGEPIVRKAFTHDPDEYNFAETDLPALYLFRTGSARNSEDIATSIRIAPDNVKLFWVLPYVEQVKQTKRVPFISALGKLIDLKIKRTRDPCFVLASDPDPSKTAEGTVVMRAAGLQELKFLQWKKTQLLIKVGAGESANRRAYAALECSIEFTEQLVQRFDDITGEPSLDALFSIEDNDDSNGPAVPFSEFDSDQPDPVDPDAL